MTFKINTLTVLTVFFTLQLIFIPFLDYKDLMNLSLFNSLLLLLIVTRNLLNNFKGVFLAILGFAVFSFFDMFKSSNLLGFSSYREASPEYYITTYWLYISFILFLLAYILTPPKKTMSTNNNLTYLSQSNFKLYILPPAFVVMVIITLLGTKNPLLLLISFLPKSVVVISFFIFIRTRNYKYLILSLSFCFFSFPEISRRVYISLFFILLAIYISYIYSTKGGLSKLNKVIFLLLFCLIFLFMGYLRSDNPESDYYVEGSRVQTSINNIMEMRAIDTFDNTVFIMSNIPKTYQYYWGETYLAIFVQLIPRSVWPDKIVSLGAPLGLLRKTGIRDFDITKWKYFVNNHSYSPGFQGEAYANFGYFGIISLSLFFGFFVKKFDTTVNLYDLINNLKILPFVSFYSSFFLISRGDMLMATYYSLMFFLFIKIIISTCEVPVVKKYYVHEQVK